MAETSEDELEKKSVEDEDVKTVAPIPGFHYPQLHQTHRICSSSWMYCFDGAFLQIVLHLMDEPHCVSSSHPGFSAALQLELLSNSSCCSQGTSPLQFSSCMHLLTKGTRAAVQVLLANGAAANIKDASGQTALAVAEHYSQRKQRVLRVVAMQRQ